MLRHQSITAKISAKSFWLNTLCLRKTCLMFHFLLPVYQEFTVLIESISLFSRPKNSNLYAKNLSRYQFISHGQREWRKIVRTWQPLLMGISKELSNVVPRMWWLLETACMVLITSRGQFQNRISSFTRSPNIKPAIVCWHTYFILEIDRQLVSKPIHWSDRAFGTLWDLRYI